MNPVVATKCSDNRPMCASIDHERNALRIQLNNIDFVFFFSFHISFVNFTVTRNHKL